MRITLALSCVFSILIFVVASNAAAEPLLLSSSANMSSPVPTPQGTIMINTITPSSGMEGTNVTIDGIGFTDDNTVHFGYGVVPHVAASDRFLEICPTNVPDCVSGVHQRITFTVPPSLIPACRFEFPMCLIASVRTQSGNFIIFITNENGTSNSINFTVVN